MILVKGNLSITVIAYSLVQTNLHLNNEKPNFRCDAFSTGGKLRLQDHYMLFTSWWLVSLIPIDIYKYVLNIGKFFQSLHNKVWMFFISTMIANKIESV